MRAKILLNLVLVFRALLTRLPQKFVLVLASTLGRLLSYFSRREIRVGVAQVSAVHRICGLLGNNVLEEAELRTRATEVVRSSFANTAESIFELLLAEKLYKKKVRSPFAEPSEFPFIDSVGNEPLHAIVRNKQPLVALSGHIGSIELLAAFHGACTGALSVVGRSMNYKFASLLLDRMRLSYGVDTFWRDEQGSTKKLLQAFKNGRMVGLLIDQDVNLDNAFSPFFGIEAAYPTAVLRLALRYRLPICTTFIVRLAHGKHRITGEMLDYDRDDPNAIDQILRIYSARLEKLIRQYPEQWVWWHRRWRRRPGIDYIKDPDSLRSNQEYIEWLDSLSPGSEKLELRSVG